MKPEIDREYLMHLLHYDPQTGAFTWMNPNSKRMRRGDRAGFLTNDGYLAIRIDGVPYRAHRLAVLYMTGEMPAEDVDHRNRDRLANQWGNLREASRQQNTSNRSVTAKNTSGVVGVRFEARRGKWLSRIKVNGRTINLGRFSDFDQAVRVRREAEIQHFGEFAP